MEVKKCDLSCLEELALWSMQSNVDMRQGSWWGDLEESPELLEESPELLEEERALMERYLTGEAYHVYEFLAEGVVVGHVVVERERRFPGVMLHNFFIRREYRRRGYGTQALHALMEYLGETALDLDVFCWNQRALAFYKHFGFKEIFLHMNYGT